MRCKACNVILEDSELSKKDSHGNFLDLCFYCLSASYFMDDEVTDDLVENYQDNAFTMDEDSDTLF
jgi:hypothetical protein